MLEGRSFIVAASVALAGCSAGGGNVASTREATGGGGASGKGGSAGTVNGGAPSTGGAAPNTCTAEELSSACGGRACGYVAGCAASCGACAPGSDCVDGQCVVPTCEPGSPDCECQSLQFDIITRQACSMDVTTGMTLDAEAFIIVNDAPQRVLAINRWGDGHLVAWCDASTLGALLEVPELVRYLGRSSEPRIASVGNESTCAPGIVGPPFVPDTVTYLGSEIPSSYLGRPEQLAADYDFVILCGYHTDWDPGWASLIGSYVAEYGKGFLAVMDYVGFDISVDDFAQMTMITSPGGVIFNPESLPHSPTSAQADIECVPGLPPPIR